MSPAKGQHILRALWLDGMMRGVHTVLDLVAPHVEEPGCGGDLREEFGAEPAVLTFRDGTFEPLGL
ncbi:hypothetical protein ACFWXO_15000 [Kitasatospora sp. NPDC059088]|uniref:hypothetical protein n=1 Tax=Kitasatospora sp. NPDC059088 TaxID=3346722 RepID=UPI0036C5A29D